MCVAVCDLPAGRVVALAVHHDGLRLVAVLLVAERVAALGVHAAAALVALHRRDALESRKKGNQDTDASPKHVCSKFVLL